MPTQPHFTPELFRFLKELRANNNREWFAANKTKFELAVRDPFLRFIADFAPLLHGINPSFVADPRPSGGSLFRIYRDIRFSEDKSPYKTHMAAQFPHVDSDKEAPAPCFYLHIEPGGCFAAAGLWHPDNRTLSRVRSSIVKRRKEWSTVKRRVEVEGDRLSRAPKGFDPNDPIVEDLKLKDFVTSARFSQAQVCSPRFLIDCAATYRKMSPLVEFLATSLGFDW
jgi:uncharacterized protein (TIGR02453 family)